MTVQKEIEFKNLLTKEEFNQLCKDFGLAAEDIISQTNTYFDTVDFQLRDASKGFRLRVVNGRNELTLKAPGENIHTMIETTRFISSDERDRIINAGTIDPSLYKEFQQLPNELHGFGSLRTERAEFAYQDGLLVLDRSHYLGHTDYEIEYEVKDVVSGQQSFLSLLKHYNIPTRKTPKKIARFMKATNEK